MRKKYFSQGFIILSLVFFMQAAFGQSFRTGGVVTDTATGETLIGVTVAEKGTGNAMMTDIDSRYAITVHPGATLEFFYVGYET